MFWPGLLLALLVIIRLELHTARGDLVELQLPAIGSIGVF
jgi:hypothetical protein